MKAENALDDEMREILDDEKLLPDGKNKQFNIL